MLLVFLYLPKTPENQRLLNIETETIDTMMPYLSKFNAILAGECFSTFATSAIKLRLQHFINIIIVWWLTNPSFSIARYNSAIISVGRLCDRIPKCIHKKSNMVPLWSQSRDSQRKSILDILGNFRIFTNTYRSMNLLFTQKSCWFNCENAVSFWRLQFMCQPFLLPLIL